MTSSPGWAQPAWTPPTGPVSFDGGPPPHRGRRRVLRTALVAVPALVVGAGVASVVTLAVVGGDHATAGTGHEASAPALGSSHHATVGTLTALDGSAWTVRTAGGQTVTVQVGSGTTFGTKAHPDQASAFHAGARVKVVGTTDGGTVDATRVVLTGAGGGRAG